MASHRTQTTIIFVLFGLLCCAVQVATAVSIVTPFDKQVAPVARTEQSYKYILPSDTFSPQNLQLSISNGPAWLKFDNVTGKLWGTPSDADVGTATFEITAKDLKSSSTTLECSFPVSSDPAPDARYSIKEVLTQSQKLAGPTTIQLQAGQFTDIQFNDSYYDGHGKKLFYYALLADRTPLPSWIDFDPDNLRFSFKPSQSLKTPQTYDILFIASDYEKFAAVTQQWSIQVTKRQWTFEPAEQTILMPSVGSLKSVSFLSLLRGDNNSTTGKDIKAVSAILPSWLDLDNSTLTVSGKAPPNVKSFDTEITTTDKMGTTANLSLHIVANSSFNGALSPIMLIPGDAFQYELPRALLVNPKDQIHVDVGNLTWIKQRVPTSGGLSLYGDVPQDTQLGTVTVELSASNVDNDKQKGIPLKLYVRSNDRDAVRSRNTSSATTTRSNPISTDAPTAQDISPRRESSKKTIVIGAVAGSLSGLILLIIVLCLCAVCRRRPVKRINKTDISRPTMEHKSPHELDLERYMDPDGTTLRTSRLMSGPSSVRQLESRGTLPTLRVNGEMVEIKTGILSKHAARASTATARASTRDTKTPPELREYRKSCGKPSSSIGTIRDSKYGFLRPGGGLTIDSRPPTIAFPNLYGFDGGNSMTDLTSILSSTGPGPSIHGAPEGWTAPQISRSSTMKRISDLRRAAAGSPMDGRPLEDKRNSYLRHRSRYRSPFFGSKRASTLSRFDWRRGTEFEDIVVKPSPIPEPEPETTSIMSRPSFKQLRRWSSDIAPIEPLKINKVKRRGSKRYRVFSEGFPRPVTISEDGRDSATRVSMSSSRYSCATNLEPRRYSRRQTLPPHAEGDDVDSEADLTEGAFSGTATPLYGTMSLPPLTKPPMKALPQIPPKSPRRSTWFRNSVVGRQRQSIAEPHAGSDDGEVGAGSGDGVEEWAAEYPPDGQAPTIEELAVALSLGKARSVDNTGSTTAAAVAAASTNTATRVPGARRKSQNFSRKLGASGGAGAGGTESDVKSVGTAVMRKKPWRTGTVPAPNPDSVLDRPRASFRRIARADAADAQGEGVEGEEEEMPTIRVVAPSTNGSAGSGSREASRGR